MLLLLSFSLTSSHSRLKVFSIFYHNALSITTVYDHFPPLSAQTFNYIDDENFTMPIRYRSRFYERRRSPPSLFANIDINYYCQILSKSFDDLVIESKYYPNIQPFFLVFDYYKKRSRN